MNKDDFEKLLDDEFYEDFGAPKLPDEEVEKMLSEARMNKDVRLRRLIKEVQLWRTFNNQFLELAEKHLPEDRVLKIARFLIRGEKLNS